ncbi:uncharacterized protein PV06_00253 [Exophiala oligosperma]|uniref:FAD-binding PCMH-type domain-containing protein n=1 Tax=Exophiala oligosperma TaxID=215243 RepID=A0A0D2DY86_9EURO|nr:uncharacterized protein PV06_00253 [Exophiala oligosperma]KIW47565.1 hypothetical protein PV06_00253 [Exophiala oligosperma]
MGPLSLPFKCEVLIPESGQSPKDVIHRWSDSFLDLPAMIVKPKCEEDIVDALVFAKQKNLTVTTTNGGRAPFVVITTKTLYLDMGNFNQVSVNTSSNTVRVGGGASTEEVIASTTAEGYYTLWPNSDAVGYVGCLLGGGSDTMNGLHGFMVDAVESMRVITGEGIKLEVSPSSTGQERNLFNALCGAGFGLAIVTSVNMKAFSIASLHLTNDCIWTRRVTLPSTAVDVATQVFSSIRTLPPPLHLTMVCVRAPPSSPSPGSPLIIITANYFGPSHEGEKATSFLYEPELLDRALKADTELVPFALANAPLKPLSANHGYKGFSSTFLQTIDSQTIQVAIEKWIELGNEYRDAYPTTLIFNKWNSEAIDRNGQEEAGNAKFFEHRGFKMMAFSMRWCMNETTRQVLDNFGDEFLRIVRRNEQGPYHCMANNQRPGMNLEELFSKKRLEDLKHVKSTWDPDHVLWSPYH